MSFIAGSDRKQPNLLPPSIEDYVSPENPVRIIDAFVESLDMTRLGFQAPKENPDGRGRPAYSPKTLLKLYIYGYQHRVRSSRGLESECARNLEVIWLTSDLQPDHKTIADFRKNNAQAFKAVLRQFTIACRDLGLFGNDLLAVDGTKVAAQNSVSRNWTLKKLKDRDNRIQAAVDEYVKALEQADQQEATPAPKLTAEELRTKIEHLKAQQNNLREITQQLESKQQTQVSATDPDSRSMKSARGFIVGYNIQGAVDSKHHMLAVTEVTNKGNDQGQLSDMAKAVKQEMGLAEGSTLVADKGYYTHDDIKQCQELGFEVHMTGSTQSKSERAGYFGTKDFQYDASADVFRCPAKQELRFRRKTSKDWCNYENPTACRDCALKSQCTDKAHRTVSRWVHSACIEKMKEQMAVAPEKLEKRKALIEHCWATLKSLLPGGFLVRGLVKVRAELSLAHLAYNFRRALNVVGFQKLLAGVLASAVKA